MEQVILTGVWQQVATGATFFLLQATLVAKVYVGPSAPAESATAFVFRCNIPQEIPQITALGGGVWVKGDGVLRYATDG